MARPLLAIIPLLLAGLAIAQPARHVDVKQLNYDANYVARRLLASDDILDVAWGAHVAAQHGLTQRIPELRQKLRETAPSHARSPGTSRLLLDALIRLEAAVPGDEVMPYFTDFPDETIVLLARTPNTNKRALLEVLERQQQTVHWLAAGGLLAKVKSAAFADYLVRRLSVTMGITVADRKTDTLVGDGGPVGAGGRHGRARYRKGLPPVPHYRIVTSRERNNTVLCAGSCPTYFKRFTSLLRPGRHTSHRDTRYHACRYLAQMVGVSYSELGFHTSLMHLLIWKGPEDMRAQVESRRRESRQSWRRLIDRLVAAKLLDPVRVAGLHPRIDVKLFDRRDDKSIPLPSIGG